MFHAVDIQLDAVLDQGAYLIPALTAAHYLGHLACLVAKYVADRAHSSGGLLHCLVYTMHGVEVGGAGDVYYPGGIIRGHFF